MSVFLVTGAAGFIGLNQCEYLTRAGHKVIGVDNFSTSYIPIYNPVIKKLEKDDNFLFYRIDLTHDKLTESYVDLRYLFRHYKIDYIIHLAAIPSIQRSIDDPSMVIKNNIKSTINLLEVARTYGIKKLVYASSSSYYGGIYIFEDEPELRPPLCKSPYAASKGTGELLVNSYYHSFNLPVTILRYFNVFGEYQNPNSQYSAVIPIFINKVLKDEQPTIYGDGNQIRDFTYVGNVVHANYLATQSKISGNILDIGYGMGMSLNGLLEMINKILGKDIKPIYEESRKGDVSYSRADILPAIRDLNFTPYIDFNEGLYRTIEYYKIMKEEKHE